MVEHIVDEERQVSDDQVASMVHLGDGVTVDPESAPSDEEFDREQEEVAKNLIPPRMPPQPDPANPDPIPGMDPLMERLTLALEALASQKTAPGSPNSDSAQMAQAIALLAGAMERMSSGQLEGSRLIADATKKAQRPSNEVYPAISAFNLRGDKDFPKPQLKCEMLLPWPADHDGSTREEVELLNLLQQGEYTVTRNDMTKIKLQVIVTTKLDSDEPSRLVINHSTAFNNDYHRTLPPLTVMLRQMLKQSLATRAAADRVLSMDEEAALIMANQLNDGTQVDKGKAVSIGE